MVTGPAGRELHSPKASPTELTSSFCLFCGFSPSGDSAIGPCSRPIFLYKPLSCLARHPLPHSRARVKIQNPQQRASPPTFFMSCNIS